MAALLDSLGQNIDLRHNLYPSSRRLAKMQANTPTFKNVKEELMWNRMYFSELLYAGKSEEAAKGFQLLLSDKKFTDLMNSEQKSELWQMLAVCYLRTGETQNCVLNHTSQSCIIPIKPEGQHKNVYGSTKALETYDAILKEYPNDLNSRWLMNIAAMTLGKYPEAVPEKFRIPENLFGKNGGFEPFTDIAIDLKLDVDGLAGGSVIEDFNNDGFLDIFCTSYGLTDQCRLYMSNGKGGFEDKTEAAQLMGIVGGLNAKQADYDNDGFTDLIILRGAWLDKGGEWPNSLLHNNGDGTFSDVTFEAGMVNFRPTETAAWSDVDGDGLLDLFIANENNRNNDYPCELWHNNGDGTFTDIAKELGVDGNFGYVKGVNVHDFNNDGRPDIFLSILADGGDRKDGNNRLFMNREGGGKYKIKFEDISKKAGITEPYFSFPSAVFDYNNDGFEDIYVCGFDFNRLEKCGEDAYREYTGMPVIAETPRLFKNNGNETFTDVTKEAKLNKVTYGMGLNFGDIDNDGWLDLYIGTGAFDFRTLVPNRLFRNVEGKYFEELTTKGVGHLQKGHGIAFGDLDNNGTQDMYCVMGGGYEGDNAKNVLFKNNAKPGNWVCVEVQAKSVNKSAHGSKIRVNVLNKKGLKRQIYASINSGATFGANSIRQEIGLGDADKIESIEILWEKKGTPKSVYNNVPLNSFVLLKEGGSTAEVKKLNSMVFSASEGGHNHHHH